MTIYASSNVQSYSGAPDCPSKGHSRKRDRKGVLLDDRLVITCAPCEQEILSIPAFRSTWSSDPKRIPLTDDEKLEADQAERDARIATAELATAMARAAQADVVSGRTRAAAGSKA